MSTRNSSARSESNDKYTANATSSINLKLRQNVALIQWQNLCYSKCLNELSTKIEVKDFTLNTSWLWTFTLSSRTHQRQGQGQRHIKTRSKTGSSPRYEWVCFIIISNVDKLLTIYTMHTAQCDIYGLLAVIIDQMKYFLDYLGVSHFVHDVEPPTAMKFRGWSAASFPGCLLYTSDAADE